MREGGKLEQDKIEGAMGMEGVYEREEGWEGEGEEGRNRSDAAKQGGRGVVAEREEGEMEGVPYIHRWIDRWLDR